MEKNKSDFYDQMALLDALEMFVQYGILRKTTKGGQPAWIENEEFNKKTPEERAAVIQRMKNAEKMTDEAIAALVTGITPSHQ